jgi:hypothetical protein
MVECWKTKFTKIFQIALLAIIRQFTLRSVLKVGKVDNKTSKVNSGVRK